LTFLSFLDVMCLYYLDSLSSKCEFILIINAYEIAAPPVLGHVSPSFLVHRDGDNVELFCDATATPEPLVTWHKDDEEMTSSERVRVTPRRVEIRNVDRMDGGSHVTSTT